MATLHIHSDEELGDLIEWSAAHPPEDGDAGYPPELTAWLLSLADFPPASHGVPPELIERLDALLDDWSEVLSSHREELHTTLEIGA